MKIHTRIFVLIGLLLLTTNVFSQDPNFYIYLCFGQSNMEGYPGTIQAKDKTVDDRFQVMEAVSCSNLGRTKGNWYTAVPPLCRCNTGLTPVDYFGRALVANLPSNVKVGVINVSVAGCAIELFDKDNYQTYASTAASWMTNIINEYGGNPYSRLVEMAKLAQKDGVIKGILLHQGESNVGDNQWTAKVKGVYDNLITDLGLDPTKVPLLAGEVVNANQGGVCSGMNSTIATLPNKIPNSYIVSSKSCTDTTDNLHFNSAGYRELGWRYGVRMLSILGVDTTKLVDVRIAEKPMDPKGTESFYYEPECATIGNNWNKKFSSLASNDYYVTVKTGLNSTSEAPADSASAIYIPFTVTKDSTYYVYARLNCATTSDDSYWIKMDNESFVICNGIIGGGWQWKKLSKTELKAGEHTLTIAYCEDGAKLDKICISNYSLAPSEMGDAAINLCVPTGLNSIKTVDGSSLGQNYPNPFNDRTTIEFEIPNNTYISLKVFNLQGVEIAELAGKEFSRGKHTVEFDSKNLSKGIYLYTIQADRFTATQKMIIEE